MSINVDNELSIIDDIESGKMEKKEKNAVKINQPKPNNTNENKESSTEEGNNNSNNEKQDEAQDILKLTPREKCPACLTNILWYTTLNYLFYI